jgi:hypothetical protein
MLVRMDVFFAKKGDDTKSAPNLSQWKHASFCMSETCCKCLKPPLRKTLHPERRENNNQVMSDRCAEKCGHFVECVRRSDRSDEVSSSRLPDSWFSWLCCPCPFSTRAESLSRSLARDCYEHPRAKSYQQNLATGLTPHAICSGVL